MVGLFEAHLHRESFRNIKEFSSMSESALVGVPLFFSFCINCCADEDETCWPQAARNGRRSRDSR